MANYTTTYTFTAGTKIKASEANANFSNIASFLNDSVMHVDGSKSFTGVPTVAGAAAVNPTSANQLTRKQYVDDQDTTITTTVTSNKTAADNAFLKRPQFTDDNRIIRAADFTGTTDANGEITVTFRNAANTNTPFPNSVITVVATSGDVGASGSNAAAVVGIKSKSTTGFVCRVWRNFGTTGIGSSVTLDVAANANVRISYFALGT